MWGIYEKQLSWEPTMQNNRLVGFAVLIISLIGLAQSFSVSQNGVWVEECLAANNITQADLMEMVKRSIAGQENATSPGKHKCFYQCLAEKENILDSKGCMDVEKINAIDHLTEKNRQALMFCKSKNDEKFEKCEYIFQMVLCLTEKIEPNYKGAETGEPAGAGKAN